MKISTIQSTILLLTFTFTAIQYSSYGIEEPYYGYIRLAIIGLIVLLLLTCKITDIVALYRKSNTYKIFFYSTLIFAILNIIFISLAVDIESSVWRDMIIVLLLFSIGYSLKLKPQNYIRLLQFFSIILLLSMISIIYTFGDGFELSDQYMPIPKNQLSPLYASLLIIISSYVYKSTNISGSTLFRIFWIVILVFYVIILMILRARATIVAALLVLAIYMMGSKDLSVKSKTLIITIGAIISFMCFGLLAEVFTAGKDLTDINSFSTGRVDRIYNGLEYWSNYPFTGSLFYDQFEGLTIHVFILKLLVDYGFILAFPVLIFYLYTFGFAINKSFHHDNHPVDFAYSLLLLFFIISLFEYSYPLSPASSTYIAYISLGYSYKFTEKSNTKAYATPYNK